MLYEARHFLKLYYLNCLFKDTVYFYYYFVIRIQPPLKLSPT